MASRATLLNIRTCQRFGLKCWPLLLDPFGDQAEKYVRLIEKGNWETTTENAQPVDFKDSNGKIVVVNGDDKMLGM